jgi:hypothetical protein
MPPLDPSRLALFRRWAVLLDSAFPIPGTSVRFGLDAIIGLVPGIGDLATPLFTGLLLVTGLRMRVPLVVQARMVVNAGLDMLLGLVPVAGDLVDVAWKANLRNLELLERHATPGVAPTHGDAWFVAIAAGLIVTVCLLALVPIVLLLWVVSALLRS